MKNERRTRARCKREGRARIATVAMAALIAVCLPVRLAVAAPERVEVTLSPQAVALGEAAQLEIEIQGEAEGEPRLPHVDGLEFVAAGTRTQMQIINGRVEVQRGFVYRVVPLREGRFTIDPSTIEVDGVKATGAPLSLEVRAATAAPGARQAQRSSAAGRDAVSEPPVPEGLEPFVRVVPERTRLYVGEPARMHIEAWFPANVAGQLESRPRLESSAFTLAGEEVEARREQRRLGGRLYTVLTWDLGFTPIKAGTYPLVVRLDATLQIPVRSRRRPRSRSSPFDRLRRRMGGSLFDDPFFDSFFDDPFFDQALSGVFTQTVARKFEMRNDPIEIEVRPLPKDGVPEGFSGAVGRFQVEAHAEPQVVTEGEPITVTIEVHGEGSFDRLGEPRLSKPEGFSVYPGKSHFEADDALGFRGVERFEVTLVPERAGLEEIPPFVVAVFDPQTERYVELETDPIPISVRPAPPTSAGGGTNTQQASSSTDEEGGEPLEAQAPNAREQGAGVRVQDPDGLWRALTDRGPYRKRLTLPWRRRAWQLAWLAALSLVVLGMGAGVVRRRRDAGAERRALRKAKRRARAFVRSAKQAAARGDVEGFFDAAAAALRVWVAAHWGRDPETISSLDLRTRLEGEVPESVVKVLETADAVAFAGHAVEPSELPMWVERLEQALKALEEVVE